ncbi:hypothetical protein CY34DRAFT_103284, partial [Suillus luteus UH-Slu-Lm8-n1]
MLRTDAGHGLLARYRRTQNSRDLDQSINHFEHALDICPKDHPCHPAALFNLATAKLVNYEVNEIYPDLDIAISVFQEALNLRPTGHPDRPVTQLYLAIALLARFAKGGLKTDRDDPHALDEVISLHYDALGYYNTKHACRGQLLGNLSVVLRTRFERRGNAEDLDQAIALAR